MADTRERGIDVDQRILFPPSLTERIWILTDRRPGGCWLWTGTLRGDGYGLIQVGRQGGGRQYRAHRLVYQLLIGPIPFGLELDHTCHSADLACPGGDSCPHRRCVNPAHLEPVTTQENTRRGRTTGPRDFCSNGHSLLDERHLYVDARGRRSCRTCAIAKKRERRRLARAASL